MQLAASAGIDQATARRVLLLAFASTTSMVMGVSSVMPMVPLLETVFAISHTEASLILTLFTLPGILLAPLAGLLADRYGRRVVLAPSLLLFSLAGGGCAFVDDFRLLLVLRCLQGMGAAPLALLNTTILADVWSGPALARVVGYNMAVLSIGSALYPTIGGFLANLSWRAPFFLPLLVLPVFVLALRLPLASPARAANFREYLLGLGRAFHNRRILVLFGITFLTFVMLYGPIITCIPALGHQRFGADPASIGVIMLFSALGLGLVSSQLGRLSQRHGPRRLLMRSQFFYLAAFLLIPLLLPAGPAILGLPLTFWLLALPVFIFGLGQGLNVPNVQTQLLQAAEPEQRASIMAVNAVLLRLGQTIGPLLFSLMMLWRGLDAGFYLAILLAAAIFLLAWRGLR